MKQNILLTSDDSAGVDLVGQVLLAVDGAAYRCWTAFEVGVAFVFGSGTLVFPFDRALAL